MWWCNSPRARHGFVPADKSKTDRDMAVLDGPVKGLAGFQPYLARIQPEIAIAMIAIINKFTKL